MTFCHFSVVKYISDHFQRVFVLNPQQLWSDIMFSILDWACSLVLRQVNWTNFLTSWWVKLLLFSWYNHLLLQVASLDRSKYYEWGPLRRNLCWSRLREFVLVTLKWSHLLLMSLRQGVCLGLFTCICSLKTECRVDPPPHLPGGHPGDKQAQAAYWSSVWGHIARANR